MGDLIRFPLERCRVPHGAGQTFSCVDEVSYMSYALIEQLMARFKSDRPRIPVFSLPPGPDWFQEHLKRSLLYGPAEWHLTWHPPEGPKGA